MRKLFILISAFIVLTANAGTYRFLVGTFTKNTPSEGIYTVSLNFKDSVFKATLAASGVKDPSYMAFSADKEYLYAVNESGEDSYISAFRFDAETGHLQFINKVQAGGADPCFISCSENHVITGNYSGGNICVFKRNTDGSVSERVQNIQHTGSSVNPTRQNKPHVHQAIFSNDKKFVLVNDLGTDLVTSYFYNKNSYDAVLALCDTLRVKAGSGPRHLTFNKKGNIAYLIQELDGTLTTFSFNKGKMKKLNETSVVKLTDLVTGAADIHLSPDGKYLYATNRGTINDISCFKIDKNGIPEFVEQISVQGNGPRNFNITSDGKYVLVGNQKSNQIVVLQRNKQTGKLTDTGIRINVGAPVCILQY